MAPNRGYYEPFFAGRPPKRNIDRHLPRLTTSRRTRQLAVTVVAALVLCTIWYMRPRALPVEEPRDPPRGLPTHIPSPDASNGVDWSRFAYTQYVTDRDYLCNSLMIFETLHRLGSKADRVLLYSDDIVLSASNNRIDATMLRKARDVYDVRLEPVRLIDHQDEDVTWSKSYTKLLAFNLTDYDRVLNVDSDSTILQDMDELFLMPSTPVALPRAYWGEPNLLSSQLLLIEPSQDEFARVMAAVKDAPEGHYDMDIMNDLYNSSAMVLPHRRYDLLSGEFRRTDHGPYLGSPSERWSAKKALKEAKFVHFSDWPVPKPWIEPPSWRIEINQPACEKRLWGRLDCTTREIWLDLYNDFKRRRLEVCGLDLRIDTEMR